ncbi:MAG: DUF3618 domain-containing protein [Mycobacteriales bacterium]
MDGPDPASPVADRLVRARDHLMGGRGPGADPAVIARHTRDRAQIGHRPVTDRLEMTARQSAAARHDPEAIAATITASRAELAQTLATLIERTHPMGLMHRGVARLPALAIPAAAALVAVYLGASHRRRSIHVDDRAEPATTA